jgi:hypothetical protein
MVSTGRDTVATDPEARALVAFSLRVHFAHRGRHPMEVAMVLGMLQMVCSGLLGFLYGSLRGSLCARHSQRAREGYGSSTAACQ